MKYLVVLVTVLLSTALLFSQQIPKKKNRTDERGLAFKAEYEKANADINSRPPQSKGCKES